MRTRGLETTRARLSVLLVEDRADDVALLRRALERSGYDVTLTVADSEDAYISGLEKHPDVIVSDYHLPAFSGERALDLAKERAPDLPFILLSGSLDQVTCANLIRRGVHACLQKSRLARLPMAIDSVLGARDRVGLIHE